MKRSTVIGFLILLPSSLALSVGALGQGEHDRMMREQAAPMREPQLETPDDLKKEIKALRERVAVLEALKPRFTNFMPNYAERFHVMHRAGDVGDWAVAAHEIDEMKRMTGVSKYIDPKLGTLMQAFMDGNLRKLREAVEHGNSKSFQAALEDTAASCNGCHKASGSTLGVSVKVSETMSMRHPHLLGKTTVPKDHGH
ncbi:MAG: hypothetical protein A3G81_13820 [Betaproteobacteria bacterium RIFCSPLOWO2_12_FULL_65_14]|nr:MAG: hypothetical protein A3G81_13820 [Betaproteobacteria bacterium RIFCSPLOWO2_12_FULL_65_14]